MGFIYKYGRRIGVLFLLLSTIIVFGSIFIGVRNKTENERVTVIQKAEFLFANELPLIDIRTDKFIVEQESYYKLETDIFVDGKYLSTITDSGSFSEIDTLKCKRYKEALIIGNRLIYLNKKKCN